MTINQAIKLDQYPIPKIEDHLTFLAEGKSFTMLVLRQAYLQLPLERESWKLAVINTQKGLFCYTRMPFGISSASGIFQRTMDNLMQGIRDVAV